MQRYIILINGAACSGKTTLKNHFLLNERKVVGISFDTLKKTISKFCNPLDSDLVLDMMFATSCTAVKYNYSLVVDCSARHIEPIRNWYSKFAIENNMVLIEINLETPLPVLKERLLERIKKGGTYNITNFRLLMDDYFSYIDKKSDVRTYLTDRESPQVIYESILVSIKCFGYGTL